ncbi:MAG: helix-turn-helix domain-containing protein, partial [Rhodoferax sp.]
MTSRQKVPKTFCTSAEAARILGVALRTVQLWSEAGLLEVWKTRGGHRRISRKSVEGLLLNPNGPQLRGPTHWVERRAKPAPLPTPFSVLVVEDNDSLREATVAF